MSTLLERENKDCPSFASIKATGVGPRVISQSRFSLEAEFTLLSLHCYHRCLGERHFYLRNVRC